VVNKSNDYLKVPVLSAKLVTEIKNKYVTFIDFWTQLFGAVIYKIDRTLA